MDLFSSGIIHEIKNETEILDLCIGYCKDSDSIPISIKYLIAIFYYIRKRMIVGNLTFRTKYTLFTSLITSIMVRNLIFKIDVKIGSLIIRLFLNQNKYSTNLINKKQNIQTISGNPWNCNYVINKSHDYYKPKQYRILFLINRQTNCHCIDSNSEIKIYILNFTTKFNCSLYTLCRYLETKNDNDLYNQNANGLIKFQLPSDVEIEQKKMEIIMNENDKGTVEICGATQSPISSCNEIILGRICCWDANQLK